MLRETISQWNEAVLAYDKSNFEEAIDILSTISEPTAKILFNIGCVHLNTGYPNKAFEVFTKAISKDEYLSVGHFQHGVAALKANRVSVASESFTKAFLYLRGNTVIDYRQLGLPILFCKSQVLINIAVCLFRQQKKSAAIKCLMDAMELKSTPSLKCALTQARDNAQDNKEFPIQELPVSAIFRPAKSVVSNLEKKDYLGKATVIASIEQNDTFTGFIGAKMKNNFKGNISPSSLNENETRHTRSLEDLAQPRSPRSPANLKKSRPPPPNCPPPRCPNRKIVCVQKSHSMESMFDNHEDSSLQSLKMANNLKTVSENNETSSSENRRREAPSRPPPVYRPKTWLLSTTRNEKTQTNKNIVSGQRDQGQQVHTQEKTAKSTPSISTDILRSPELKPPPYLPPQRKTLGNGLSNSENKISSRTVVAVYSLVAAETGQLNFMEGEIISVQEDVDKSWFQGRLRGQSGLVPWSYVQPYVRKSVFH